MRFSGQARPLALLCLAVALASAQADGLIGVRYCVPADVGQAFLGRCREVMGRLTKYSNEKIGFSCVSGGSVAGCVAKIANGDAELTTLDGGHMYMADVSRGLVPIVAEDYGGEEGTEYYSVAVVNKDFCEDKDGKAKKNVTLASLKGKDACMTGYQRTVGWVMPAGELLSSKTMPLLSEDPRVEDVAESMADFFGKVCAAQSGNGAAISKDGTVTAYSGLCGGCKDDCDESDSYYSYEGALRCLNDGADVAFVKHSTPLDFAKDGSDPQSWSKLEKSDMRLLCPGKSGGCADVDDYKQCNWGRVPAHAIVASKKIGLGPLGGSIRGAFAKAATDKEWLADASDIDGLDGVLISSDTRSLSPLDVSDASEYFSKDALANYEAVFKASKAARFCAATSEELEECENVVAALRGFDAMLAAKGNSSGLQWGCVQRESVPECLKALANGEAEMRVVDGSQMYEATQRYSLEPLVAERYEDSTGDGKEYFAVAVVDKAFCELKGKDADLSDLRGVSSCHTGYRRSAGWWVPLGALAAEGVITATPPKDGIAGDALAMDGFFDGVCAAGLTADGPVMTDDGPTYYSRLCTACKEDCKDSDEYASYDGAFRGLMEGSCGVAFTKHAVPLMYAKDGTQPAKWSDKEKDDFRLLCRTGGCMSLDDYEDCNLAEIPAHAVVTTPALTYEKQLRDFLVAASKDKETAKQMFEKEDFWGEETIALTPVTGSAKEYLGEADDLYAALYNQGWTGEGEAEAEAVFNRRGKTIVCLPYYATQNFEEQCSDLMREANVKGVDFTCYRGRDMDTCLRMVANGTAAFTMMDSSDVHTAMTQYGLVPVAAEHYQDQKDGTAYHAVAVVDKDFCEDKDGNPKKDLTFKSLKGKHSCHTGYGKSAGWNAPVGLMLRTGVLSAPEDPIEGVVADARAVDEFFDGVCAPRVTPSGPRIAFDNVGNGKATTYAGICSLCKGDCTAQDPYYDYDGAMQCLLDGKGDVAFVKHTTALSIDSNSTKDDLRLLCPAGGCKKLDEYEKCSVSRVPPHAIVGRPDEVNGAAIKALVAKSEDADWMNMITETQTTEGNIIFKPGTKQLDLVTDPADYLGKDYKAGLDALARFNQPTLRWCVNTWDELKFCSEHMPALNNGQNFANFTCVKPANNRTCAQAVGEGAAHLTVLDANDVFHAADQYNVEVVAAEDFGNGALEYYGVAVVDKSFCNGKVSFNSLRNKDVCSSGYRKAAGFSMPTGYMLASGIMPYVGLDPAVNNDAESFSAFFGEACAPGVTMTGPKLSSNGTTQNWDKLCSSCAGDCSESDPYFDVSGAMHCLMDGAGHVAFTKHFGPLEFAKDSEAAQKWSTMSRSDMRLLCPEGGCAAVDDYESCHIAAVPSNGVIMVRNSPFKWPVQAALEAANDIRKFESHVFSTINNPDSFMFRSAAAGVKAFNSTVNSYLGDKTRMAFEGLVALEPAPGASAQENAGR